MAHLYKRGNIWWAKIYKDGTPSYYSLETSNKRDAKELLEIKELELHSISLSSLLRKWEVNKFMETILPERKELPVSEKFNTTPYIKMVKYKFNMLIKVFGDVPAVSITDTMLNVWKKSLTELQSENTAGIVFRCIQPVFSFAVKNNYILKNPFNNVKIPKGTPRKDYFEEKELKILYDVVDRPLIKKYFEFFVKTGIRPSEMRNLKWSDFNHPDFIIFQGKEGKREFPKWESIKKLAAEIKELQKDYPDNDIFFINENGDSLVNHDRLGKLFKKYLKKTPLYEKKPNLVLYSMRHTFATRLLQKGYDIYKVSKWMGHKSVTTTERSYAHIVAKKLEEPDVEFD